MLQLTAASPDETRTAGARLGSILEAGDVVLLRGDLGAGKTCFTQGIARGLDISELVVSPTFVLINEYLGRQRLYHADLYRLEEPGEVADLHLSDSTEDGVLVVEWPERDDGSLPVEYILVRLEYEGATRRRLTFSHRGERPAAVIRALGASRADHRAFTNRTN